MWKKSFVCGVVFFSFFTLMGITAAQAAETVTPEYVVEGNKLYKKTGDKKELMEKVEALPVKGAELVAYPVSKTQNPAMEGSAIGVYFFNKDGVFQKLLPFEKDDFATHMTDIVFSPNGELVVFDSGTAPERNIDFYDYKNGAKTFTVMALTPYYWVDDTRFLMTTMDTDTFSREGVNYGSGTPMSVALYDVANKNLIYLKKSSSLADYTIASYDAANKSYTFKEVLVPTPADWKDATKYQETTSQPLPLP